MGRLLAPTNDRFPAAKSCCSAFPNPMVVTGRSCCAAVVQHAVLDGGNKPGPDICPGTANWRWGAICSSPW
jgi:hypothetical protein